MQHVRAHIRDDGFALGTRHADANGIATRALGPVWAFARFYRSPRSPWPFVVLVLAFRFRSYPNERLTSSGSLNFPFVSPRTYRLSVPVLISVRLVAFFFAMIVSSDQACNAHASDADERP